MSSLECVTCGLTPADLPDEIEPEYAFTHTNGDCYCMADDPASGGQ